MFGSSVRASTARHSLFGALDDGVRVATILEKCTEQLKHLEIHEEEPNDRDCIRDIPLIAGSFPYLETLTISGTHGFAFSLASVLRLLHLAPNLVQLALHDFWTFEPEEPITEILVLPHLSTCLPNMFSLDKILRHLSLPVLETLCVPLNGITFSELSLFLKRSSPPLRHLIIGEECLDFPFSALEEWLRFVPSLLQLELHWVQQPVANDLFAALAETASHLLPHLQNLQLHVYLESQFETPPPGSLAYETLL
ncbi:hypothetical protein B0H16DRAFT_1709151 [Mycena metata]|uniref:Uncharacterized protein n=1 Tax=Mycena metata TaxID=1033252 RepID=A0AAD7KJE9_9AGAR|nr:hypothetical protein B0H16DRAFT_1709151 [Mycena metata]